jgi:DNA-binding transcriptional regulator YiaG
MVDKFGYSEDYLQQRTLFVHPAKPKHEGYTCIPKRVKEEAVQKIKNGQASVDEMAATLNTSRRNVKNWLKLKIIN